MATPNEKLAESLDALKSLQERGVTAIRSGSLTRTHRERLLKNGFLRKVMKGWYLPVRPDDVAGDSTPWYASFWDFCADYFQERFGADWCFSPEQSLLLHAGNMTVPPQVLARSPKARNKITPLIHDTSVFDVRAALPESGQISEMNGLRLFSVPSGLVNCRPEFFLRCPAEARTVLAGVRDASEILALLLENGRSTVAGRLAGAFRNIGRNRTADDIVKTMKAAGYDIIEKAPFGDTVDHTLLSLPLSPHVSRIQFMWRGMRESVLKIFPLPPGPPSNIDVYLKNADDIYVTDAYHSLSIEGYRVSSELIERVRTGEWSPDENKDDRDHRNALAARGYWQAYQSVRESVRRVLEGDNPGATVEDSHGDWYREMFGPGVTAGLVSAAALAGYRSSPVFIRQSRHVPPRYEAVRDCMQAFFDLLKEEPEPSVRAVLGHFFFVYIHPYMDGNGRMARFLMNVMMASGGYGWTVIPVEKRDRYMAALESASVAQDIGPFAQFLADIVSGKIK